MEKKVKIQLIITDLDNTLYDWVDFFVPAFYAMIRKASELLNTEIDTLIKETKKVHEKFNNTEQPFALLYTPTVISKLDGLPKIEQREYLSDAFNEFNRIRDERLKLYPKVKETLEIIKQNNSILVGHTEALTVNAILRLRKLGILECFDKIYSVKNLHSTHPNQLITFKDLDKNKSVWSKIRALKAKERKPSPEIVNEIVSHYNIDKSRTLYVGDNIVRDIVMAKNAGIRAALAKYGSKHNEEFWKLLVKVSHWTKTDVKKNDAQKKLYEHIEPDFILEEELFEIFKYIEPISVTADHRDILI